MLAPPAASDRRRERGLVLHRGGRLGTRCPGPSRWREQNSVTPAPPRTEARSRLLDDEVDPGTCLWDDTHTAAWPRGDTWLGPGAGLRGHSKALGAAEQGPGGAGPGSGFTGRSQEPVSEPLSPGLPAGLSSVSLYLGLARQGWAAQGQCAPSGNPLPSVPAAPPVCKKGLATPPAVGPSSSAVLWKSEGNCSFPRVGFINQG